MTSTQRSFDHPIEVPPYRLSALSRPERAVALVLVLVLLAPFALSVARAIQADWYPLGDDALISLRAQEASRADFPLVGQPSTSHLYTENRIAHPGPIEFYWLAAPQRLLGPALGTILAMSALYFSAVLVSAWIVFRRAGPMPGAIACVALTGVLSASGGALLIDPLSSNAGGLPLLVLFAGAAAVAQGDIRLLPVTVAYGSWVAQQHLAIVLPAVVLVAITVGGVVAATIGASSRERRISIARWGGASVLWGLFLWLPVIIDQFFGTGNLTAMFGYSGEGGSKVPADVAAGVALRAVAAPTLLVRTEISQIGLVTSPSPLLILGAVTTLAVLLAAAVWAGPRSRGARVWLGVTVALAISGFFNTMNVPNSLEQFRINFYRWAPVVGFGLVVVAGWLATDYLGRWARRNAAKPIQHSSQQKVRWAALGTAVVVGAVPAVMALLNPGPDDRFREQAIFGDLAEMRATMLEETRDDSKVTLLESGIGSVLVVSPMLDLALTVDGHEVQSAFLVKNFGDPESLTDSDPGATYGIESSAELQNRPGRVVKRWDVGRDIAELRDELLAQYRDDPTLVVADDGRQRLVDRYQEGFADAIIENIPGDSSVSDRPASASRLVDDGSFLTAVGIGYYSVHPFDTELIEDYKAASEVPSLTGERYLTILEIDEVEYDRLVDRPIVVPEAGN